jgi:cyclic pyranopterin monophosphate synthase
MKKNKGQKNLSHLDEKGLPAMVDISSKHATAREACAESCVIFPANVAKQIKDANGISGKGPIIETAVIAGTMAVKKTAELIPFCHPLPIEGVRFELAWLPKHQLNIRCSVKTFHRTGVEMEALTGASVAALTVYDMCKALSHELIIGPTQLIKKRGGKNDVDKQ